MLRPLLSVRLSQGWNQIIVGWRDIHHIVAFCNFRWPLLCSSFFALYFRVVFLRKKNDPVRCFIWQSSHKQPWPVSSTSAVGLFLLSEHAWPTRATPPLSGCQKFVSSSLCYQKHWIIPSTSGESTFHLIRHRYVPGTCMYAMSLVRDARPRIFYIRPRSLLNLLL